MSRSRSCRMRRCATTLTEHKQLMRAALNRETDKTIELNRLHISRTLDKVAASLAAGKGTGARRKSFQMNVAVQDGPVIGPGRQARRVRRATLCRRGRAGRPLPPTSPMGWSRPISRGLSSHGVMLIDMYIERLRKGLGLARHTSRRRFGTARRGRSRRRQCARPVDRRCRRWSIAIDKARQFAAGIVTVRHGFHFGTAGRYAQHAAKAGCVGIAMCNTRPLMPAPGGAERVVGNNPLAIAVPVDDEIPIVLDMATSEAAMGKIRMAEKAKEAIPPTWAVTAQGLPTTNAAEAIAGMLLPSGGPKGFGLSFLIDLLCGLLSQGAIGAQVRPLYGDFAVPYDCSHLFIAIDVAHFCDLDWFRRQAAQAAARIRGGARTPGVAELFTPGEPEWRRRQRSGGDVRLEPPVVAMLTRYAGELGVATTLFEYRAQDEAPCLKFRFRVRNCGSPTACSRTPPPSRRPAALSSSPG